MEETVVISKSELESLKKAAIELEYLEKWGVDNWEGYGDAMKDMRAEFGNE